MAAMAAAAAETSSSRRSQAVKARPRRQRAGKLAPAAPRVLPGQAWAAMPTAAKA